MRKILMLVLVSSLAAGQVWAAAEDTRPSGTMILPLSESLPMAEKQVIKENLSKDTRAYQQYARRPKTEFSKLIYLMEILKTGDQKILYNNRPYEPKQIVGLVKAFIALNYKKEKAEDWIKANAYRSRSKGLIIYVLQPDGTKQPLRDRLLEELALISNLT
jgi:hypothetical protein